MVEAGGGVPGDGVPGGGVPGGADLPGADATVGAFVDASAGLVPDAPVEVPGGAPADHGEDAPADEPDRPDADLPDAAPGEEDGDGLADIPFDGSGPLSVEVGGDRWRLVLRPRADAPRLARDFVAQACREWRAPGWDASGTLITSELVTNAVRHAGTDITLRLERTPAGLVIAVDDGSGGDPHIVPAEQRLGGGRGLAIVEQLAAEWGVSTRTGGKTVWARLAPAAAEDDGSEDGEPDDDETVVVALPWGKDLVVVARSTAGHLGARAGFTRQEVEDFRLAVNEACGLLLTRAVASKKKAGIECRFTVSPGSVAFSVTAPVADRTAPPLGDFGWSLLEALVDEVEWSNGNLTCGVRGLKRKWVAP